MAKARIGYAALSVPLALAIINSTMAADTAENYPVKAVRMIVPFSAGGGVDMVARAIGMKLTDTLKQSFVIDNRTGAGGSIGPGVVARAEPDGYTLLLTSISLAFNATLYPNLPYDTLNELTAITLVANSPNVMVVHPSMPVKTVKELIAFAKGRPGQLNYGTGGVGGSSHIAAEYFLRAAGLQIVHVPYKGVAPALTELLAGNIHLSMAPIAPALPLTRTGRLRALGVSTATRTSLMPDIPTIAEAGLSGFDYSTWYGLLATGGTPKAVVTKLNEELKRVLQSNDLRDRMVPQGLEPTWMTPEQFSAYLKSEIVKWAPILKAIAPAQ